MALRIQLGKRNFDSEENNVRRGRKTRRLPALVLKGYLAPKDGRVISDQNECEGKGEIDGADDVVKCVECDKTFDSLMALYQHCDEQHPKLDGSGDAPVMDTDGDNSGSNGEMDNGNNDDEPVDNATTNDSSRISTNEPTIRTTWCDICKKHLATVSSRNLHMRIHTGERPFVCPFCNKAFTQNVHLRSHMSVHTGAKPYVCEVCGKGFVASRTLKIHMMSHSRETPHSCRWCSRKFLLRNHLIMHMQTHHGADQSSSKLSPRASSALQPIPGSGASSNCTSKSKYHLKPPQRVLVTNATPEGASRDFASARNEEYTGQFFGGQQDKNGTATFQREAEDEEEDHPVKVEESDAGHCDWKTTSAITVKPASPDNEPSHLCHQSPVATVSSVFGRAASARSSVASGSRLSAARIVSSAWRNGGNGGQSNRKTANSASTVGERQHQAASGCPNCTIVESELQLLKNELAVIKQFLGNKLTLMEQKIDNIRVLIK